MARKSGSDARETAQRIRDAARRLIAAHGYAAVSMRQIAGEAGVQAGAIYLHFADKQALLFQLMDGHMSALLAAWAAEETDSDLPGRLRQFAEFHIRYHLERPDEVFIAYMELRNLSPENFAVIEDKRRAYERELEDILVAGQESGAFRFADLRLTTMAIIAMLTGVNTWYRAEGRLAPDRVARLYGQLAWRLAGFQAEPE